MIFFRLGMKWSNCQQLNDIDRLRNAIAMAVENDTEFYSNYESPDVYRYVRSYPTQSFHFLTTLFFHPTTFVLTVLKIPFSHFFS